MALVTKAAQTVAKPTGAFPAVVVDAIDAGWWPPGPKAERPEYVHKVKLRFFYKGEDPETGAERGYYVDFFASNSIGDNSNLGKFLSAWRGKPFTREEKDGFDLETLIGTKCLINVVEAKKEGYVDVGSASKLPASLRALAPDIPSDYVRDKDTAEPLWKQNPKPRAGVQHAKVTRADFDDTSDEPAPVSAVRKAAIAGATAKAAVHEEPLPAALEDDDDELPF